MPKERSLNPAAAQRKADKQKEIAKSKKQQQQQRNERLSRRNPERVQRQIDELKELDGRGALRPKDKETLGQLERELKGIRRAREALGDAAPKFPGHDRGPRPDARQEQRARRQNLGKRRRDSAEEAMAEEGDEDGSDTDPEARAIPMPRDTPPPIPRKQRAAFGDPQVGADGVRVPHALPAKPTPAAPVQTVYSSAPQLRNLTKEAAKFVPSAVAQQKRRVKGEGRLLEPEEIEKLEQAGYYAANKAAEEADHEARLKQAQVQANATSKPETDLDAEFRQFESEINDIYPPKAEQGLPRHVQLEEVDDEGD